jgi:hypothetical protein
MIEVETQAEATRIAERIGREKEVDLEAMELYVRTGMLAAGASVLERLLRDVGVGSRQEPLVCTNKHLPVAMQSSGIRVKIIETILGPFPFERSRYVCPICGAVRYPGDELLGVKATSFSPGLRRLMTRAGSRESFDEAAEDLQVYGGGHTDAKNVERVAETMGRKIDHWMLVQASLAVGREESRQERIPILYTALDGTGAPMRKSELANTRGKSEDGKARTREVKLGCVFTQTACDEEGNPIRDAQSTTYVGAIESSVDFGNRLHLEAVRRGLGRAEQVVVLSDGADYNARIVKAHFPMATHILDFYHASERLSDFVKETTAHPVDGAFHERCYALLKEGQIEMLLETMRAELPRRGKTRQQGIQQIAYFAARIEQMRYAEFKRKGFFIGSGVIEAGCKTLIGKRLKNSGMFWTVEGANAIIAARCCLYSGRFEDFWEDTGS